jgi:hypothetical protein
LHQNPQQKTHDTNHTSNGDDTQAESTKQQRNTNQADVKAPEKKQPRFTIEQDATNSRWYQLDDGRRLPQDPGCETAEEAQAIADKFNTPQVDENQPEQPQSDSAEPESTPAAPIAAKEPATEGAMADLTSLTQQQLVDKANRAVYPEDAPLPANKTMGDFLSAVRHADAMYSDDGKNWTAVGTVENCRTIQELIEYAANAKKKRLLDERLVYWLKLMAVKFTVRLMRNRNAWINSMLNLSYAEK